MPDTLLKVENLTAGYVAGLPILQDLTMAAENGRMTAIIGPNGAGKSTLIKAIMGFLNIAHGRISVGGEDITGLKPDVLARHGVAYVPQTDNVFRTLTIRQNLDLVLKGKNTERLAALLDRFPALEQKQSEKAGSLSGGQRQFLAVAMALAADPCVILMDEPSAGLSPKAAEEVLDHAKALTEQGTTILLVEQNVKQALKRSDYCFLLAEGRNHIEGPAADLLNDPALGRIYLGGERRVPA